MEPLTLDQISPRSEAPSPRPRILVIDDEPGVRTVLERALMRAGYEVRLAADGREGLELLCSQKADLALTDLYMPGQEGVETIKDFRARFPGLKIMAMSGGPDAKTMLFVARKLGSIEVLQKPFSVSLLLDAVERALGTEPPRTRLKLEAK